MHFLSRLGLSPTPTYPYPPFTRTSWRYSSLGCCLAAPRLFSILILDHSRFIRSSRDQHSVSITRDSDYHSMSLPHSPRSRQRSHQRTQNRDPNAAALPTECVPVDAADPAHGFQSQTKDSESGAKSGRQCEATGKCDLDATAKELSDREGRPHSCQDAQGTMEVATISASVMWEGLDAFFRVGTRGLFWGT